jgi:hypothetical protein
MGAFVLEFQSFQMDMTVEDLFSLPDRHAALVKKVEAKCEELTEGNHYEQLGSLADKLTMMRGLNIPDMTTIVKGDFSKNVVVFSTRRSCSLPPYHE